MALRSIDLNLVPVLQALLREKSVSRAAETLALSQPAASAALKRLRILFGDQLLVRVGSTMVLTPRAEDLAAQVNASCAGLEALFVEPVFDPATAVRRFVIAAPDQAAFLLGPAWLRMLDQHAPGVRVRFVDLGEQTALDLTDRAVDFAIFPSFFVEDLPPAPLHYQPLFRDASVAMFRAGHTLGQLESIRREDLARWRMIGFHPGFTRIERKRRTALVGAIDAEPLADVAQTTLPPFLLLGTDYFTIASQRLAERLAKILPLAWRPFAFATDPIEMGLAWSQVQEEEPAHRWFRTMIIDAAAVSAPTW